MKTFLFRSKQTPDVFAFTTDSLGQNLPGEFAPWIAVDGQLMPSSSGHSKALQEALQKEGFYVARAAPE